MASILFRQTGHVHAKLIVSFIQWMFASGILDPGGPLAGHPSQRIWFPWSAKALGAVHNMALAQGSVNDIHQVKPSVQPC